MIIKFRLRDYNNKIVGYEKWDSGTLHPEGYWRIKPRWLYSIDNKRWSPKLIIPHNSKDQFVGIVDKNDKEIYAGDIFISIDPNTKNDKRTYRDEWHKSAWYGCTNPDGEGYLISVHNLDGIEIIGNIYENPELIKRR